MMSCQWVLPPIVLAIHQSQLIEHGGDTGVRDEGLLASAFARPQNHLAYGEPEPDIAALAASYAYGICKHHPFVDGNKRVAYVTARIFLLRNGHDIKATREEKVYIVLSLASGDLTEAQLAEWFRENLVGADA
jgi:death-on-curing protein